jgi:division protein CdvB (Snf7/Vps24/ESCRT-III family)
VCGISGRKPLKELDKELNQILEEYNTIIEKIFFF